MQRQLIVECFGTFCLVFVGTGAVVVESIHPGTVTHVGISLTFGLIVLSMIYALGEISGCHLNPAVTLGFLAARRFPSSRVVPYILAQVIGAILASVLLKILFPGDSTLLGSTQPTGTAIQSWVLEFILTMILMVVILNVSTGAKEKGILAGVAVGSLIALEALFGGPVSGASMNPARSLAPALVSGTPSALWIYLTAPILGAIAGVGIWKAIAVDPARGPLSNDSQQAGRA